MIYKIRLNSEFFYGAEGSGEWACAKFKAGMDDTMEAIWKTLSEEMRENISKIRGRLPGDREDAKCKRCDGKGYRDERKHWIPLRSGRKKCFACMGSCVEPCMDPIWFRRRVVDTILEYPDKAEAWAEKVLASDNVYLPVLKDIAETILAGGDVSTLPY